MAESKANVFEVVLLIVGIGVAFLGFQLITYVYNLENKQLSWTMVVAIFSWLTLLVMFILLSLMVDLSKRELSSIQKMMELLSKKGKK